MKYLFNISFVSLFSFLSMLFGINQFVYASSYEMQKVVYHVNYDNPKRQAGALRNIQNHINAVGKDKLDIKVVMHGKGLSLMLLPEQAENTKLPVGNAGQSLQQKVDSLRSQGVQFNVCANTLKGKNIKLEHLYNTFSDDIVPSGVAEIAKLQVSGFSYLRP